MFEPIWKAVRRELSGDQARAYAARIWAHARWNSFDGIQRAAAEIADIARDIGLADVDIRQYPADGVTSHGGWVMPRAWDAQDARLQIVAPPDVPRQTLADYRECPQSLIMYSAPTPAEGVEAEVVAVSNASKAEAYDGLDVAGKLVLADGMGLDVAALAFERGALGIVCDTVKLAGSPQEKTPGHFDNACQWHNYTIPPWRGPHEGFGFSITPADGRRLRELLRSHPHVRLRAVVQTRLYDGHVPLVTGLLPGRSREEILITGHLCEPGANDNASGCGLGLEVLRTIRALCEKGDLRALERGIRFIFSFEVRGYQAYLAEAMGLRHLVAGINLDMVGNDLSDARSVCNLLCNWPVAPAYTDFLAVALLTRLQGEDPLFRFRTQRTELVDNLFGEPSVGAPMCVLGCWPDATYHTSLDVIDTLSPRAMASLGRVAATYCAFLAGAGLEEALWLARTTQVSAEGGMAETGHRLADAGRGPAAIHEYLDHMARYNVARLRSIARLVRPPGDMPTTENVRKHADRFCRTSGLIADEELKRRLQTYASRILSFARRKQEELAEDAGAAPRADVPAPPAEAEDRARRLVPLRTFRGSLCFESLDAAARADLTRRTGLAVGWGAPTWLQLAVFLASGKRSVFDIWRDLKYEAENLALGRLCDTFEFLADHGFVRMRPVLSKADYLDALARVGLPPGQVVMAHTSLSRFGYVEGGADTVIDALLEAVGPRGTLVMPTLSCSWAGRPPFDPAATPARIGTIPNVFRLRPGVRRSPHPTHSVAAVGPHADDITRRHSADEPVFAETGAFGRLYALDARILMLAPLATNTCLHMGEERAGIPLADLAARVDDQGQPAGVIRRAPWHVNFEPHYDRLREGGLLRSAPLGEGTVYLMSMRDAVDAATENLRRNPRLVAQDGCECELCRRVRAIG